MKYVTAAVLTIGATILFSACTFGGSSTKKPATSPATGAKAPAAEDKSGDTVKTGTISQSGGKYFIKTQTSPSPEEIDSYVVDLAGYVGQTVTITGQYSGDTLFVGMVE